MLTKLIFFCFKKKQIILSIIIYLYFTSSILCVYTYLYSYNCYFNYDFSKFFCIHVPHIFIFYLFIFFYFFSTFLTFFFKKRTTNSLKFNFLIIIFCGLVGIISGICWSFFIWSNKFTIDNKIYLIILILIIVFITHKLFNLINSRCNYNLGLYIVCINFILILILSILSTKWNNLHHDSSLIINYNFFFKSIKNILIYMYTNIYGTIYFILYILYIM